MSDVVDQAEQKDEAFAPPVAAAPANSLLGNLAARRRALVDEQRLELHVPRWTDPPLVVTYRPLSHEEAVRVNRRAEKIKDSAARDLTAMSDMLVLACTAVEAVIDGQRYSLRPGDPEGTPTRVDEDLARCLGVEGQGARATVQALFLTEPDLLAQAKRLQEWSGYAEQTSAEDFLGE